MYYALCVLVMLPRSVQNEFPALLTWKLGVSLAVRDLVLQGVIADMPFSKIAIVLKARANERVPRARAAIPQHH